MRLPRFILLLSAGSLGACHAGSEIGAPNLAPRPIEARPILPPDQASEPQLPVDPAITARLSAIVSDAEAGHRGFEKARVDAAGAIERGRGAPAGSEAWITAQQSLTALDAAKGAVRGAGAELDALRQDPASYASGNRAAIEAAAARIGAMGDEEDKAAATLAARLG